MQIIDLDIDYKIADLWHLRKPDFNRFWNQMQLAYYYADVLNDFFMRVNYDKKFLFNRKLGLKFLLYFKRASLFHSEVTLSQTSLC